MKGKESGKEILCWFNFAKELCLENVYFLRYEMLKNCYLRYYFFLNIAETATHFLKEL